MAQHKRPAVAAWSTPMLGAAADKTADAELLRLRIGADAKALLAAARSMATRKQGSSALRECTVQCTQKVPHQ